MAHYSNRPSFKQLNTDPPSVGYNTGDLRTNLTAFDRLLKGLLVSMVSEASSSSGKDLSVSNSRFYVADLLMYIETRSQEHN